MKNEIVNRFGERLDYSWREPDGEASGRGAVVILGHGLTGNKDRPMLVDLADALSDEGFASLRFSFAGNGASQGKFAEATISKEVGDLQAVIDAVATEHPGRLLVYVGHSMGAAVGVSVAAKDKRLAALVSLAGMVQTREFVEREFGGLTPGEDCMWDEANCPLSVEFVDNLTQISDLTELARTVTIPWLLVHGDADDVVPIADSRLLEPLSDQCSILEMEGVDHSFTEHHGTLCEAVTGWLVALLQPQN